MPSRRRSSSTQESSEASLTRPTDGAGHGLRSTRAIVSSAYVIRDVPQSMRKSDISTDASDISNGRDRRAMTSRYRSKSLGATRMSASQRLKQRRRNSGYEGGSGDVLTNEIDTAESYSRDEKKEQFRSKISTCQRLKQGRKSSGYDGGQDDAPTNNSKSVDHKDDTKEESIGLNQSTNEILSDYIQLKLELAELQSKLQFAEADTKIKIKSLQAQNQMLEKENASLIERNKELEEENGRLTQGRRFGRIRRVSLPERVSSVISNRPNSCMLGSHSEHQRTVSRQVAARHQSSLKEVKLNEAIPQVEASKSPALSSSEKRNQRKDSPARKTTNIPNDRELYKQISLYKKQQSMERSSTPERKHTQSKQRKSHTSTSDTSCETSSVHRQMQHHLSVQKPRSPILCFSIQPESVTSDYCEFSVIEPV
jgi:hypothetical protein